MSKRAYPPPESFTVSSRSSDDLMRDLVYNFDWPTVQLDTVEDWDLTLKTTVDLCLNSPMPMLLLWGPDLIQIYNDGYRRIIGRKHNSLGKKAKDVWADLWPEIGPLLEKVLNAGESFLHEDRPFHVDRKGYPEECYFTFSYSPIRTPEGRIAGVLVIVTETTQRVISENTLRFLRNEQLKKLFLQAPMALCILSGPQFRVEVANDKILDLWGRTFNQVVNKPFFEAVPTSKNQGFETLLQRVYHLGERIIINEMSLTLDRGVGSETIYIKFVYEALRDEDGKISGVMVLADEITEQVRARKALEEIEIRQKIAIEAAAIGTFDWDIVNSVFLYSDRLAHIFGYTDTKALTQNDFGNRIHADDQPMRMAAHREAFENGTLFYEARVVWPDQSLHWVRLNGKVIYDSNGKPSRMYGTTLDITEQRQQSERLEKLVEQRTQKLQERNHELQQSEERYHKMVEEVQDYAIILLDRDGNILNWNRGAEKIKGYHESEIIGKNFRVFYLPEDRENQLPERLINNAITNGRATHEGWRQRKNGSKFWGSITITALHNDKREIIGFSKVTRDLTERKMTEDSLKAYAVGLEFQNRELEQFAYVASHDLQEPLRKIQTFCEVVQRSNYDLETTAKFFPKILNSAQRMSDLIRSVLNYSRLSKEGQTFLQIDLNAVIATIKNDFELMIEEKNARIEVEKLPSIEGIPLQVNQLFTNLIGNALKFNKSQPIIQIKSRAVSTHEVLNAPGSLPDKTYMEISVADNGIGFEQRHEQVIFAMFQRLNSKQEYSGTGIGLALCKKIMDNHNGHITAQSEPGKGAIFFVYFPID